MGTLTITEKKHCFCSFTFNYLLFNHIQYHKNYLKFTNLIPAQNFRHLFTKPDTINIITSGITTIRLLCRNEDSLIASI